MLEWLLQRRFHRVRNNYWESNRVDRSRTFYYQAGGQFCGLSIEGDFEFHPVYRLNRDKRLLKKRIKRKRKREGFIVRYIKRKRKIKKEKLCLVLVCLRNRATAPETCGVAIEVPDILAVRSSRIPA